jgi:MFS family permease
MLEKAKSIIRSISAETFNSLSVRNYRLYYIGQIVSTSGTFMQTVAQGWLVLQLTNSGTALGIVSALQYLPLLILGPWGGVIADRYNKRQILFFTQSFAGLLALALGALVVSGLIQLWMIYILAFCLGLNSVIDNPTRLTFYIELVGPERLRNAVTLYSTLVNVSRVIGPATAAGLIAGVGIGACFLINGVSYFAVVLTLAMMNKSDISVSQPIPRGKGQLLEGIKYIISTPVIGYPLLVMAILGTFTYEFQVTLPLMAKNVLHSGAGGYAYLTAAMGLGASVGGLYFAGQKRGSPSRIGPAAFLFGLAVLAVSLMPDLHLAGIAMAVVGFCSINYSTLGSTTLQLESSPEMRGRVMSFWSSSFLGMTTIGGPIIGAFAELAGARASLALGGSAAIFAAGIAMVKLKNPVTNQALPASAAINKKSGKI